MNEQNAIQHEPLKPDLNWRQVNSSDWLNDAGAGLNNHGPSDYAHGFEDGAYALAEVAMRLLETRDMLGLVKLLAPYKERLAHPVRGWKQEPVRN